MRHGARGGRRARIASSRGPCRRAGCRRRRSAMRSPGRRAHRASGSGRSSCRRRRSTCRRAVAAALDGDEQLRGAREVHGFANVGAPRGCTISAGCLSIEALSTRRARRRRHARAAAGCRAGFAELLHGGAFERHARAVAGQRVDVRIDAPSTGSRWRRSAPLTGSEVPIAAAKEPRTNPRRFMLVPLALSGRRRPLFDGTFCARPGGSC